MKALLIAASATALLREPADACAVKHNEIVIVLGVAHGDLVTLRIDLAERELDGEMVKTGWHGAARYEIGTRSSARLGSLDPKADASREIDRLIGRARASAAKLPGFVSARRVSATDCTINPTKNCGDAALENHGAELRVGTVRRPFTIKDVSARGELAVLGVVRYRVGADDVTVVNVGIGGTKFSRTLRSCEASPCREITTLHHGEQVDVVVTGA